MGKSRFARLTDMLPGDVSILGLDEHTACIIDLERQEFAVRGIGRVTWQRAGKEAVFEKGDRFALGLLREGRMNSEPVQSARPVRGVATAEEKREGASFWEQVHAVEAEFQRGLDHHKPQEVTSALLELDRIIWQGHESLENEEFIAQAREIFRDQIVVLGTKLASVPKNETDCLMPVVDELLELRQRFRANRQWAEADAIRDSLERSQIAIEDTPEGTRWQLKS
jgi:cysteinyl-tRNA synthetase